MCAMTLHMRLCVPMYQSSCVQPGPACSMHLLQFIAGSPIPPCPFPSPGPTFSQQPHSQDAPAPGHSPARAPHTLACALECGLLHFVEATLRSCLREAARPPARYYDAPNYRRIGLEKAAVFIDLALRRHGHWPAVLSYGDPQAAAALVLTLGKAARMAAQGDADASGRLAKEDPGLALRLQLLALLEQLGPQHGCHVAVGGGAGGGGGAASSSSGGGDAGQGPAAPPELLLNRKVGGATRRRDAGGAGVCGSSSNSSAAQVLPAWAAGPTWRQVEEAGGCPAPGTPPQLQLARLTALAVAEWLPALLAQPHASGTPGAVSAVPLGAMLTHGSYRVAWAWLRHVARQALRAPGAGGEGQERAAGGGRPSTPTSTPAAPMCHPGWTAFLLDRLAAAQHLRGVLVLAVEDWKRMQERAAGGPHGTPVESRAAAAAAREVLPAALDVLGAVALAAPGRLRAALVRHEGLMRAQVDADGKPAWKVDDVKSALDSGLLQRMIGDMVGQGCTLPWSDVYLEEVEGRQGRQGLGRAIRALLQQKQGQEGQPQQQGQEQQHQGQVQGPGGDAFCGSAEGRALWEELQVRFGGGGMPQVPLPGPQVDPGLPRCGNAACARMEGRSEAGVRLQACGRCRAVGYCCAECQRADWAAGHKAACGRAGLGQATG